MTLLAHVCRIPSAHPSRVPAAATLTALLSAMSLTACASLSSLGASNHDGGKSDAATTKQDAAAEAAAACAGDDAGYHDFTNEACWTKYEPPSSVDPDPGYSGGTFDGRYVYVASSVDALVVRYDTQSPFTAPGSWSSHDTSQVDGAGQLQSPGYQGVVFDGRYVYLVAFNGTGGFVRYDSTASFDSASSWSAYVLASPGSISYSGGTFDGRYVYFTPVTDGNDNASGQVARYDTTQPFGSSSSWSVFDAMSLGAAAEPDAGDGSGDAGDSTRAGALTGAIFDGRYVYFVPGTDISFVMPRYDTTAAFEATSSWDLIDLANTPNAYDCAFVAGAFDGSHVYVVPETGADTGLSFDVTTPFTSPSSWTDYAPPLSVTSTFTVGAFDGRYIYYIPAFSSVAGVNTRSAAAFVRFNAVPGAGGFTNAANWSSHDATHLNASGFGAAVFDGRYLYLAPYYQGAFARFDAKDVSAQPSLPHYFGSFF